MALDLNWQGKGPTIAYPALLESAAVPFTLWLMVTIGNSSGNAGSPVLWAGAFVVGGLTPALARLLVVLVRR